MGRVYFLTCFHQLLLREKPSFTNADEAVQVFSSLLVDLQNLQVSLAENTFSLQWCTDVVNLLRKMHIHFLCFVQRVNCIEEYMKQSLILLDFCNTLKSAVCEMNRYRLLIKVAAKKLQDEASLSTPTSRNEMERLEREGKKLYNYTTNKKGKDLNLFNHDIPKTKSKDVNVGVVYALQGSMSTLCLLLFSAIFNPVSIKVNDGLYTSLPQLKLFSISLRKLVHSFFEGLDDEEGMNKVNCTIRPVLVENIKMVESMVFGIKQCKGIDDDEEKHVKKNSIDSMKNQSIALKEGLEMFDCVVMDLFEEVVKGRNKVLAMVTVA